MPKSVTIYAGSERFEGRTRKAAEEARDAFLARVFDGSNETPGVLSFVDAGGVDTLAIAWRRSDGGWCYGMTSPGRDTLRAWLDLPVGEGRDACTRAMHRHAAQNAFRFVSDESNAVAEDGERYILPDDKAGLDSHRYWVRWQIRYRAAWRAAHAAIRDDSI